MNRRTTGRGAPRQHTGGGIRSVKMQELNRDQEAARNRAAGGGLEWKRMDLHLHTPASSDYRDPGISYLDILKKTEEKNLDIIAFTDHNTVAGYAAMHREIETLTLLERLGRMSDQERDTLSEYRRLLAKINVLPGFEFTATFGFHILGIFPENTSVRKLEYLLLNLNVPEEKMLGAPDAGSTSDVLSAYQAITSAGGLAIAAHANSSNGVAMQGFPFGGQTKIAYTQDANLVALEVTDMEAQGRRNTASFYNGSKTEYPRRMHIIQGSDAHSLNTEQLDGMNKRLGVGARITEILVKDATFASLKELLQGTDFTRTRPYRAGMSWDSVEKARLEGQTMNQSFHERAFTHTSRARPILHDIVAFSNAEGGTIFVGANPDLGVPIHGIERPDEAIRMLKEDIRRTIEPPVELEYSIQGGQERGVVVLTVPKGAEIPYAFTPTGQVYIRLEGESVVANRDEIVALVLSAHSQGMARIVAPVPTVGAQPAPQICAGSTPSDVGEPMAPAQIISPAVPAPAQPQTGQKAAQPRREERRAQPPPVKQPQESQPTRQAPQPLQAAPTTPAPQASQPPADRTMRPPVFANLPPEKLKGNIRPMAPTGAAPPVEQEISTREPGLVAPAQPEPTMPEFEVGPDTSQPVDMLASEIVEAMAVLETPEAPAAPSGRRGRGRRQQATQPEAVEAPIETPELLEVVAEAQPEPQPEAKKTSRSRSRKKAAEVEAEMPPADEPNTPLESTISAEHLTREELVAAEPEPPARGKGRGRKRDKQMEVDAPAAAAAETEAAEVALLVQAEVEPGAQIPGELTAEEAAPEITSPAPPSRKRSRGKTVAQQTAESDADAAEAPAQPQPDAEMLQEPGQASAPAEQPAATSGKSRRGRGRKPGADEQPTATDASKDAQAATTGAQSGLGPTAPTTGVEIISTDERNGILYHTMRDLRNPSSVVHNVTRKSARRLWLYAIMQHEHGDPTPAELAWHPTAPLGLWRREHRAGASRYDLAARYPDGSLRLFYGVTDEGLLGQWRELIAMAENADYWGPPPIEK